MNDDQEFDCETCRDTGIVDGEPCPDCESDVIDDEEVCDFDDDY